MRLQGSLTFLTLATITGCYDPAGPSGSGTVDESGSTSTPTTTTAGTEPTMSGGDPTSASNTMTSSTLDTTASEESTTSPPLACEGADGELDPACTDPSEPFCLGGTCVGCEALDADACAAIDPATPICDGGVCSGCTEHDQCPTLACRITTGECFAEPNRLWVDNNAADCAGATGGEGAPFCTLAAAQDVLDAQPGTEPWAVFVAGSATAYADPISSGARPLAFIGPARGLAARIERDQAGVASSGNDDELYLARLTLAGGSDSFPTVNVNGGNTFIDDCTLDGTSGQTLSVGGTARVRRSSFGSYGRTVRVETGGVLVMVDSEVANQSGAMLVEGEATLVRSRIHYSYVEGGIELVGTLRMINSMVYDNYYSIGDIEAMPGSSLELVYSVVGPDGIACPGTPGQSQQLIRNSIVLGIECPSAVIHNSAVATDAAVMQGQDNVLIGMPDWPTVFVNATGNGNDLDYHVLPDAPIVTDLAVWMDGDPDDDIDGDARPAEPGAPDVAGADVP